MLQQLRALTEDENILGHWTYQCGSVEKVFSCIFQLLQDNYSDLSPRDEASLRDRPIVPVGKTLVKANRLFFRLAKDLAPFSMRYQEHLELMIYFQGNLGFVIFLSPKIMHYLSMS